MPNLVEQLHAAGRQALAAGRGVQAAQILGQALGLQESASLWNDWATAQWRLQQAPEAVEGYRCALELDPANLPAATNLALSLARSQRWGEASPWLALALARTPAIALAPPGNGSLRAELAVLLAEAARRIPEPWNPDAAEAFLRRFAGQDPNTLDYFQTHLRRYVATLEMVPMAQPGQRLLELGAAFHHLTPALRRLKGYLDIRCSDVWQGGLQAEHRALSHDGTEGYRFLVDNFDVERAPWPYPDASFDVVLCCEILEHVVLDPMAMLAEINRVLRPEGRLVLTTPNIASAKGVDSLARGEAPYCWSQYEPLGLPTDRHNREYATAEVVRLLDCAGMKPVQLRTKNFYWAKPTAIRARLVAQGCSIAYRGDTTMVVACKSGAVRERYPTEFYMTTGSQERRRTAQAEAIGVVSAPAAVLAPVAVLG